MPRKSRFFSGGFIDVVSLIAVVFLLVTAVTGAIVVNKENTNFDIRNKAMSVTGKCANGASAPDGDVSQCPKATTKPSTTSTTSTNTTPATTTQTVTQPQTTTSKSNTQTCTVVKLNTAGTCPDGKTIKYVWRNADCSTSTDTCASSPTTTQPTTKITPPTPEKTTTTPTFCTEANQQLMFSSYTCVISYHGTFSSSTSGQGCCTIGTAPNGTQTCSLNSKPVCPDGSVPQCNGTTWSPCPVFTQQCTPGKTQCSGTELQTCSVGGVWISQYCSIGCANGACKQPQVQPPPTTSTNVITQTDCNTCLKNNSPSECLTVCLNTGGTITTPLGQKECDSALNPPSCSGSGLKICSSSGYWGLTTCQNGCENNACKSNSSPFAALNGLGLPSGLSGNSSIPIPQSAITSQAGFQQYAHTVGSGFVTGGATGALALGGPVIIPEAITGITATNAVVGGGLATLPAATLTYATIALSTAPSWVTPALTVAGTVPGIISNTKCLIYPELCTAQDQMNIFMTGVGVQQLSEQQAIQNISLQRANTSQIPQTNTLTLYHGAAFKNNASIMKNGIYGVGDGIAPTLTDKIDTAVEYASGQGFSMTGVSVRDPINGGYIYQVDVPIDKVTLSDTLLSGEKVYTLSLNNPAQPGAPYESWKTLSPEYIKAIYRVDPNGVITNITELK